MSAPTEREAIARLIASRDGEFANHEDYLESADLIIAEHIEPLRALLDEAIQIIEAIEFLNKESPNE